MLRRAVILASIGALFSGCPDSHGELDVGPSDDAPSPRDEGTPDDTPILRPDVPLPDAPAADAPLPEPCDPPGAFEDVDCGRCGTVTRFCTSGRVWEYGDCSEPPDAECMPGESGTTACGTMCGTQPARCDTMCHWVPSGTCTETGSCVPGATERTAMGCAAGESRGRACLDTCEWGAYGPCSAAPDDFDGDGATYDVDCDDTRPSVRPGSTRPCGSFYCAGSAMPMPGAQTCDGPGWSTCERPCPETTMCRSGTSETARCPTAGCDRAASERRTCGATGTWGAWSGCAAPMARPSSCDPVLSGACGACGEGAIYTICDAACMMVDTACQGAGCTPGTRSRDLTTCPAGEYRDLVCDDACTTTSTACMAFPPLVDILILVDVTGSHTSLVTSNAAVLATELAGGVLADADVRVGVAHFADFPHGVFGSAPDEPFAGDLVPTADGMMVTAALAGLPARGGGDGPESAVEALWVLAGGMPHPDSMPFMCPAGLAAGGCWRAGAQRAVVVITDISQHNAPHPALPAGELVDPYAGFSPLPPVWSTVRDRMVAEGVALFAIVPESTGWGTPSYEVVPQMELLVRELGQDPLDSVAVYPTGERDLTTVSRQMATMLARYLGLM